MKKETKHKIEYIGTIIIDDEWIFTVSSTISGSQNYKELVILHQPCGVKPEIRITTLNNEVQPIYQCPKCGKILPLNEIWKTVGSFYGKEILTGGMQWKG